MAHFAVILTQDRGQRPPQEPKPTTVGQFLEAKPEPGVAVEEISVGALFPKLTNPWPLNKNWDIKPDPIPPAITDGNQVAVITEQNRIGGQLIRHHNPTTGVSVLKNLFYRVGLTEFVHKLTGETHVTPGVNLFGETKKIDAFGCSSLSVGAQQGTISETIGEENDSFTPANQFAIRSAFLLPTQEADGLLMLSVRRTVFPHLLLRYRLWDPKCQALADMSISLEPRYQNPLSLILPMEDNLFFYRIAPGKMPELIDYQRAQELKKKHKQLGFKNDAIGGILSAMKHKTATESYFEYMSKTGTLGTFY